MSSMAVATIPLSTGAEARVRNRGAELAIVLANGGTARLETGTWSATTELLAQELAAGHPEVTTLEIRYRVRSWKALPSCIDDADAALTVARVEGAARVLMIGFSMGGAVAVGAAGRDRVWGILGLAPWIPERLSLEALAGKRFDVVHGAWDRSLPGLPGVHPESSRKAFERALQAGATGTYTIVPGGVHGIALRRPGGGLVRLPRWRNWLAEADAALARFASPA
jgi:dienelactone hydrolase